jgi:neutral ceramidase
MGYSFAAGTTDGPGEFNFEQGTNSSNPFWNFVSDILQKPSPQQIKCQAPKPILLDTGEIKEGKAWHTYWQPSVVDISLLQIGQFVIIATPGEFTTMAGRRLRNAVQQTLIANGFPNDTTVVIAGLSNTYSSYITTFEEYQIQRYEGGSTIYGPYTLDAYIQEFTALAVSLATGTTPNPGPSPPNMIDDLLELLPPVLFDDLPAGKSFGEVDVDVNPSYSVGEIAQVTFWSANPRSNRTAQGTYMTVEQAPNWDVVFVDGDWDTQYEWVPHGVLSGVSLATMYWNITEAVAPGYYRIRHFGTSKNLLGELKPFFGSSSDFLVTAN